MEFIEMTSMEELDEYMKDKNVTQFKQRELSEIEKNALENAKTLGAKGIADSPVTIESVFNYINSVRFGGEGIFARIENASETSKYKTGSQILSIYSYAKKVVTYPEHIHGRKLIEMQFDNEGHMCTDTDTPYRPQPVYYSFGFSKSSLVSWKKIGMLEKYTTAEFVTQLLIQLRNMLFEDMCQTMDAIALSYASIDMPITASARKKTFKQISRDLEKYLNKANW